MYKRPPFAAFTPVGASSPAYSPPQSSASSAIISYAGSDYSCPPSPSLSSSFSTPFGSSFPSSPVLSPAGGATAGPPGVVPEVALPGPVSPAGQQEPTRDEIATYAATVIRNEAFALLSLAARLAPRSAQTRLIPDFDAAPAAQETSSRGSSALAAPLSEGQPSPGSSLVIEDDELDERLARSAELMSVSEASSEADGQDSPQRRLSVPFEDETESYKSFMHCVDSIRRLPRHGKVVVTGVGKSGIVGRKMVATFNSLGIQSTFLHPLEALHGDLGCICSCSTWASTSASSANACDALLMVSHSGATAELMRLLPIVRPRVRHMFAVTKDPESILARACGGWLDSGTGIRHAPSLSQDPSEKLTDEADAALPAPTSSVVTALAVGDALALVLSRLKVGWSADGKARRKEFLYCHPGGQLGIELVREGRVPPEPLQPSPVAGAGIAVAAAA